MRRKPEALAALKRGLRSALATGGRSKPRRREREDEDDGGEEGGERVRRQPQQKPEKAAKPKGFADLVTPKR